MDTTYSRLAERRFLRTLTATAVRPDADIDLTDVIVTGTNARTQMRRSSGRCTNCHHQLVLGDCSFCMRRIGALPEPEPPTRSADSAALSVLLLHTTLVMVTSLAGLVLILAWVG